MFQRSRLLTTAILFAAALLVVAAGSSQAQDTYSENQLRSFAGAVIAVNAVVEKWRPQIVDQTDEAQARAMAEQANGEMRAAVEGTDGITVEEYQQIAEAAQNDPALIARIDAIMAELGAQ